MRALLGLVLVLAVAVVASGGDDAKEKLNGTWKITSMSMDGQDVPEEVAKMLSYTFSNGKATARGRLVSAGGRFLPAAGSDSYTMTLGEASGQKTIELKPTARGRKPIPGIYELDGDTLKLCLGYAGKRPKDFANPGVEGAAVMTCTREKK